MKNVKFQRGTVSHTVNFFCLDNPKSGYTNVIRLKVPRDSELITNIIPKLIAKLDANAIDRDQLIAELLRLGGTDEGPRGGEGFDSAKTSEKPKRTNPDSGPSTFSERLLALKKLDPQDALQAASALLPELKDLKLDDGRGQHPDPLRYPGRGQHGELWLRNRLFWLRTIPLDDSSAFIATHLEYPAYLKDAGKRPSDLLGLFRGKINKTITTALAVVELKASRGTTSADDNLIYAILEASRNALLNYQGLQRLQDGWKEHIASPTEAPERMFWQTVWQEDVETTNRNPFARLNREGKIVVLIVGDAAWFDGQQPFLDVARKLNDNIRNQIPQLHILFYKLNEAQPGSSPYSLLPLSRIPSMGP